MALKVLPASVAQDRERMARFEREDGHVYTQPVGIGAATDHFEMANNWSLAPIIRAVDFLWISASCAGRSVSLPW